MPRPDAAENGFAWAGTGLYAGEEVMICGHVFSGGVSKGLVVSVCLVGTRAFGEERGELHWRPQSRGGRPVLTPPPAVLTFASVESYAFSLPLFFLSLSSLSLSPSSLSSPLFVCCVAPPVTRLLCRAACDPSAVSRRL